jgi:hypothetical protein
MYLRAGLDTETRGKITCLCWGSKIEVTSKNISIKNMTGKQFQFAVNVMKNNKQPHIFYVDLKPWHLTYGHLGSHVMKQSDYHKMQLRQKGIIRGARLLEGYTE